MQSLSRKNKGIKGIKGMCYRRYAYSRYAFVIPLKDKKELVLLMHLIK